MTFIEFCNLITAAIQKCENIEELTSKYQNLYTQALQLHEARRALLRNQVDLIRSITAAAFPDYQQNPSMSEGTTEGEMIALSELGSALRKRTFELGVFGVSKSPEDMYRHMSEMYQQMISMAYQQGGFNRGLPFDFKGIPAGFGFGVPYRGGFGSPGWASGPLRQWFQSPMEQTSFVTHPDGGINQT